jgi:hypothetical protein
LSASIESLRKEQRIHKSRIADLESRTEERAVQIAGEWFTSKAQVKAFIMNEMGSDNSGVGLLCLDSISSFQLMQIDFGSRAERFDQEHKGNRIDMEDPVYQVVFYSYCVEVPECMGGLVTQSAHNPTKLMKIPTYEEFNGNGDAHDGLKNRWSTEFSKMDDSYAGAVERANLTGKLELLVSKLKLMSLTFNEKLMQFMCDQCNIYGASTGLTLPARWALVQRLVRIVFQEIAKVRRKPAYIPARAAKNESAEYMWACLQAHRVMSEFLEKKFVNHPAIAPILTSHMLSIVSFKEDVKHGADALLKLQSNVDKQLKAMQDLTTNANASANIAKEKATQALSKAPPKKKSKPGDAEEEQK